MLRFFLIILVVTGLWWFLFRFSKVSTAKQKQMMIKFLLFGLAGFLLLMVATGRAPWFFALIGAAIPWLQRLVVLKQAWNMFKKPAESTASTSGESTVSSEFLQMRLQHDTEQIDGTILKGDYQGQLLSELSLKQLQQLWSQYSADIDSQNLLRAYLEYKFPEQWYEGLSDHQQTDNQASTQLMSRQEALSILGLDENASEEQITAAHKKLMQKLHPDRGGSEYLASKINQAKSVLLP